MIYVLYGWIFSFHLPWSTFVTLLKAFCVSNALYFCSSNRSSLRSHKLQQFPLSPTPECYNNCSESLQHQHQCNSTKENPVEPYLSINQHCQHKSASTSINQHWSASIRINQHQLESISINRHQSASISINRNQSAPVSNNQHFNQHQSAFVIDFASIYTCINAPNLWGAWGGYREILRSVRRLCEKVVRGQLQELLLELTKYAITITIEWSVPTSQDLLVRFEWLQCSNFTILSQQTFENHVHEFI